MHDNRAFEQTNPDQLLLFKWGTGQKSARKEKRNEEKLKIKKWTGLLYTIIRAVILVLELLKHFK